MGGHIWRINKEEYYLDEEVLELVDSIMPRLYEDDDDEPDYENCLYRDEFLNAGIEPKHIEYAYKNRREFLAVAAEGDFTKYSPGFKEILRKLGMPNYVFDLEASSATKENCELLEKIRQENPTVKDFDEISELVIDANNESDKNFDIFFEKLSSLLKK